jgi:hypothetical protein
LLAGVKDAFIQGKVMSGQHSYRPPIVRSLDVNRLAELSDEAADSGEEDGLEGNQQYRDIRFITWAQVADGIAREQELFARFAAAEDVEEEAKRYTEEIEEALFPEEDLWGLDIGVIGAVLALSALGAVTVTSCNAGGFGGRHTEAFPLVVFYLPQAAADEVMAVAQTADVGLDMTEGGLVRLYGRTDFDLHRFAEIALARRPKREGR